MNDYLFPFEKLDVYQLSVDLAEYVLELLDKFPLNGLVNSLKGKKRKSPTPIIDN